MTEALIGLKKNDDAIPVGNRLGAALPENRSPEAVVGVGASAQKGETGLRHKRFWVSCIRQARSILKRSAFTREHGWTNTEPPPPESIWRNRATSICKAFNAPPGKDFYTGVNAASKSLLLGEHETSAQLAERVEKIVGTEPIANDYWKTATVAEVQLLRANYDKAAQLYQAAVVVAPDDIGSHESTCAQARFFC